MYILIYLIDGQQYGIPLKQVQSAVLAVEVTPLPGSPDYILGAINVRGEILPVIDTRKLLGLNSRELEASDQFILCLFNQNPMAIWVDSIKEIKLYKEDDLIPADQILPHMEGLQHVIKKNDQMILLYDLEQELKCVVQ